MISDSLGAATGVGQSGCNACVPLVMVEGRIPCHPERSKVPTLNIRAQTVVERVGPATPEVVG